MAGPLDRRRFLGHLGSATVGAAAGAGGAVAWGSPGGTARPSGEQPPGRTWSPYGSHQPGVATPTSAVVEVVALDLHADALADGSAVARLLRVWTGDVEALTAGRPAPGDTAPWLATPGADLTITVGLGPRALVTADARGPAGFGTVPPMRHDRLDRRWVGGDLVLLVMGRDGTTTGHAVRRLVADARPFATRRWRQVGSWNGVGADGRPVTGRNIFGQVDGSANPRPGTPLFDRTVWVGSGPWAGGTTLVVRRIRMDLDAWDELTGEEQKRSVGRRLDDGSPLTGGAELDDLDLSVRRHGRSVVVAHDAHARRAHPSLNRGARIFRKGANYVVEEGATTESGLVFLSFQADLGGQFVPVQRTLDQSDALNEWTTAIGSASFAILPGFRRGGWLGETVVAERRD